VLCPSLFSFQSEADLCSSLEQERELFEKALVFVRAKRVAVVVEMFSLFLSLREKHKSFD
jgi:hypothetical protein